jgi:hypothetical protein
MTTVFFDFEFTGLHKNTTLISMGFVSECGKSLYIECTGYNNHDVDEWLQTNVVDKLFLDKKKHGITGKTTDGNDWLFKGDKYEASILVQTWLKQFEQVEMWGDCLSYDWVLFCDLFGNAFNIPKNVYYIPFDLCTLFRSKGIDPDVDREKFGCGEVYSEMPKHNALWDAKVIKLCYDKLTRND